MRYAAMVLSVILLVGLLPGGAAAHGTAGLEKVPLKEVSLLPDHLAYYVEPYVSERRDESGKTRRWYAWEFGAVEQRGARAMLNVMVKDQKDGSLANERMFFQRNPDGTWSHVNEAGAVIEKTVFTYVKPFNMNRTIGYAIALLTILGYAALRLAAWRRKRSRADAAI